MSSALTNQSSIVQFIEQNWSLGQIPGSAANIVRLGGRPVRLHATRSRLANAAVSSTRRQVSRATPSRGPIPPNGRGRPGTTVTISGLNFSTVTGETRVFFGSGRHGRQLARVDGAVGAGDDLHRHRPAGSAGPQVPVTGRVGHSGGNDAGEYTYTS